MTSQMKPGLALNAQELAVDLNEIGTEQVVAGSPHAGFVEITNFAGVDLGVWEHTVGVSHDTESDEIFIVLSGHATITFLNSPDVDVSVGPGSMVQLAAGMETEWNVTKTLRKVYISASEE